MAPTRKYKQEQITTALDAVRGGMGIREACRTYKVPKTTLLDKFRGRTPVESRMGRDPYLSQEDELSIVRWIEKQGKRGVPPKKNDVLNSAAEIVRKKKIKTPFANSRPGETWFKGFRRRHPCLSIRTPERVSKARAKVTEAGLRNWFENLKNELDEMGQFDILNDPSRVFNTDETNIQLSPDTGKVVSFKEWKNVYERSPGTEKSTLTFLGTFSARGDIVAPFIIFPYVRIPKEISESVPDNWMAGHSETGWMKVENFYEFILNGFVPWLNTHEITRPVILFVDGHKTHTSLEVSSLCEREGIILYLLPPNSTHILQPADVGPFKPLKAGWRAQVHAFQMENPNTVVTRKTVGKLLEKVINNLSKSAVINGFAASGLCPFNPDRVDYSKIVEPIPSNDDNEAEPSGESQHAKLSKDQKKKIFEELLKEVAPDLVEQLRKNECEHEALQIAWDKIFETRQDIVPPVESEIEVGYQSDATNIVMPDVSDLSLNQNESVLMRESAFYIKNPQMEHSYFIKNTENENKRKHIDPIPSTSSAFEGDGCFPGIIKSKKICRTKKDKIPCVSMAKKYKEYYENKEEEKNQKQQKKKSKRKKKTYSKENEDWTCMHCKGSWNFDRQSEVNLTWVNCDSCKLPTHVKCIPTDHSSWFDLQNLTGSDDEEVAYLCPNCFDVRNTDSD